MIMIFLPTAQENLVWHIAPVQETPRVSSFLTPFVSIHMSRPVTRIAISQCRGFLMSSSGFRLYWYLQKDFRNLSLSPSWLSNFSDFCISVIKRSILSNFKAYNKSLHTQVGYHNVHLLPKAWNVKQRCSLVDVCQQNRLYLLIRVNLMISCL